MHMHNGFGFAVFFLVVVLIVALIARSESRS
jgi:hypothetical protein